MAAERESKDVQQAREAYAQFAASVEPSRLVFIDESGCNLAMTRDYGRGPKGERVGGTKPASWGDNVTMIGGIGLDGLRAMMTVNGGTTGDVFRAYIEQVLAPKLRQGDIVIMDNLSAHKVGGIQETIEAKGAALKYLPPYSPDKNPIEQFWSKLKSILKTIGARTRAALDAAIAQALTHVTIDDCYGWFTHCGYAS